MQKEILQFAEIATCSTEIARSMALNKATHCARQSVPHNFIGPFSAFCLTLPSLMSHTVLTTRSTKSSSGPEARKRPLSLISELHGSRALHGSIQRAHCASLSANV